MDALPDIGTQVWIGPTCGPVYQGRPYRFLVTGALDTGNGTALITGHRPGVEEEPYSLPVQLDGLEPVGARSSSVAATSGTLPSAGDIIRVNPRAARDIPAGAWLRVIRTRSCTIPLWTYVDFHLLDDHGEPTRQSSVLLPIASITLYPSGFTGAPGGSHG